MPMYAESPAKFESLAAKRSTQAACIYRSAGSSIRPRHSCHEPTEWRLARPPTAAKHHFAAGNPQNVQAPGWLNSMDPPIGLRRVALKSRYPASQRRRGYKAARGLDLIKSRLDVWAKLHQLVVPGIPRIDGGQVQLGQIAPS